MTERNPRNDWWVKMLKGCACLGSALLSRQEEWGWRTIWPKMLLSLGLLLGATTLAAIAYLRWPLLVEYQARKSLWNFFFRRNYGQLEKCGVPVQTPISFCFGSRPWKLNEVADELYADDKVKPQWAGKGKKSQPTRLFCYSSLNPYNKQWISHTIECA